ncbi:MAG TPA: TauD/TfdA family dioxygenase [Novosphingobium sp.]|nr:TauD/TfdA family dioxygenase [Novosphingobium sp.]
MTIRFEDLKPAFGCRVVWDDREDIFTPEAIAALRDKLAERTVLVFPGLDPTDAEQVRFTDLIGERIAMTASVTDGTVDESIYRISLDRTINPRPEYVYATYFWHMDGISNSDVRPCATFLTCRKRAPKGGQTEFASTYAAWEGLPDEDKAALEGVRIVHSVQSGIVRAFGAQAPAEDPRAAGMVLRRDHPAVWTHATGRKSLVIGSTAESVVGLPMPEGRALIERLTEWAVQPDFTYRHDWREGDFVVWDNTGAMHRVVPYAEDSGRLMHRTSVAGIEAIS